MRIFFFIVFIFVTGICNTIVAQKLNYEISDNASKMFDLGNYQRAKELYRAIYKKDLTNVKIKYRFAVCLTYTYEEMDAIKMLEAVAKKPNVPLEVWYHLARAYHLSNRFDKAISIYKKYIETKGAKLPLITDSKRNIVMCNNAIQLVKNSLLVEFENLGKRVNSKGREYLPLITPDESILLYTTRRQGTTGRVYDLQGYYTADIYLAKYKYSKWSRARSLGYPNSYGNEQTAGISENGKYVLYHVNNPNSKNNLQLSTKSRSSFKRAIKIDTKKINSNSSLQLAATISNDGETLLFTSDRTGGQGGSDIYSCKKLPDGKWAEPTNMGNIINSTYDESYPYLTDNGKTLYFSSNGFNSMGGFDIFKSTYNKSTKKWTKPVNIGYPINTADDNTNISFTKNKKYAYVSTHRKDSYGDLDIYRINFLKTPPSYTTIKGKVLKTDSSNYKLPLRIEVFDKKTEELYGIYEVNPKNGNYIMILPPNKYELNIDIPQEGYFNQLLLVEGRNKYRKETKHNIIVSFEVQK